MKSVLKTCRALARRTPSPHKTYRRMIEYLPAGSNDTALKFLRSKHLFFVVSTGRTGSAWLSKLLNHDPRARAEHEPVLWEQVAHRDAIQDPGSAKEYVEKFRLKHMYLQWRDFEDTGRDTFGEVNSALRRHVVATREWLPEATFIHVVRDGTQFVRSVMSRSTYGGADPVYGTFHPPAIDEYSARWDELSEFEKTCWAWQYSNRYMRETVGNTVRFEEMLRSYEIFSDQILARIGLAVPEQVWRDSVSRPRNITTDYRMGKWPDWTRAQQDTFREICGEEMAAYGYEPGAPAGLNGASGREEVSRV